MTEAEYLIGLSQIALGLTGFTGVVVAFGYRPTEWSKADRMRLFLLITSSIADIFLALVPLGLSELGLESPRLWRVASLISMLCFLVIAILYFARFLDLNKKEREDVSIPLTLFLTVGTFANMLAQFLNAVGVFRAAFGVFLFGLLWCLFVPAIQFGRMVYVHFVNPPYNKKQSD